MKAATRALGIAANALTFTTLFFLFGHDASPATRRVFDGAFLAGFALAAVGLILLLVQAQKKTVLGGGLVALIVVPLLICGLLSCLLLAR
jgi:hypothetical protein